MDRRALVSRQSAQELVSRESAAQRRMRTRGRGERRPGRTCRRGRTGSSRDPAGASGPPCTGSRRSSWSAPYAHRCGRCEGSMVAPYVLRTLVNHDAAFWTAILACSQIISTLGAQPIPTPPTAPASTCQMNEYRDTTYHTNDPVRDYKYIERQSQNANYFDRLPSLHSRAFKLLVRSSSTINITDYGWRCEGWSKHVDRTMRHLNTSEHTAYINTVIIAHYPHTDSGDDKCSGAC